jgi:hypothetical protein
MSAAHQWPGELVAYADLRLVRDLGITAMAKLPDSIETLQVRKLDYFDL